MIKKTSKGYALYSLRTGKKLGTYKSIEAAQLREKQIQYFKDARRMQRQ